MVASRAQRQRRHKRPAPIDRLVAFTTRMGIQYSHRYPAPEWEMEKACVLAVLPSGPSLALVKPGKLFGPSRATSQPVWRRRATALCPAWESSPHMAPYPPENCDLAVWLLPLTVIALGAVDPILFLESSWGFPHTVVGRSKSTVGSQEHHHEYP